MNLYRQKILQHYKTPHNQGHLSNPNKKSKLVNKSCGDEIEIEIKTDNKIVKEIAFSGHGCVISTATASILTDYVKGKSIEEIKKITKEDLIKMIGIEITPARLKCLLLPLETIQKTLTQ